MKKDGTEQPHHGHKWMPAMYANYYGILKDIAEKNGYALAAHGSFTRDLDLIAVPWIEGAADPNTLIEQMSQALGAPNLTAVGGTDQKPHGRVAYGIVVGGGGFIDISVMPRDKPPEPTGVDENGNPIRHYLSASEPEPKEETEEETEPDWCLTYELLMENTNKHIDGLKCKHCGAYSKYLNWMIPHLLSEHEDKLNWDTPPEPESSEGEKERFNNIVDKTLEGLPKYLQYLLCDLSDANYARWKDRPYTVGHAIVMRTGFTTNQNIWIKSLKATPSEHVAQEQQKKTCLICGNEVDDQGHHIHYCVNCKSRVIDGQFVGPRQVMCMKCWTERGNDKDYILEEFETVEQCFDANWGCDACPDCKHYNKDCPPKDQGEG